MIANPSQARVSAVIPNWNGRQWLPRCLEAIARQQLQFDEVLVVDNGSHDDSLYYVRSEHPGARVIELRENTGFAHAANVGISEAGGDLVALVNADVVLAEDWLARMVAALLQAEGAASAACKMLSLADPQRIDDAGDVLRRDGACEQRGRFARDDGSWEQPGDVFGACAGAALYRRDAVLAIGAFDERYFAYLEDVDLALRLKLDGWRCRYEPAVALHAAQSSSAALPGGHLPLVARNTLILVAKTFPLRWLPYVAYRQLAWAWRAAQEGRLSAHLHGLASAVPHLPGALRDRKAIRQRAVVPIESAVPKRPFRGAEAGGHPSQIAASEEAVTCIWCGGAHARLRRAVHAPPDWSAHAPTKGSPHAATPSHPYAIAICDRCRAGTTYPVPERDELEAAYGQWYRPASGRFGTVGDRVLALSRASLARRLDRIAPPGPILDVGSGDGTLLAALRRLGREAVGLERDARGEGVVAAEVSDFREREGEWAAVAFWHTLEHLRDPGAALDRAAALLAPGGVLVLAVPNLDSWQAQRFGPRWFHLDLPRHLVHLPAATLEQGLRDRGFELERRSGWRGGQLVFGWLHGLVGLLPGRPDLYGAIRQADAREHRLKDSARAAALAEAVVLSPGAALLAGAEVAAGHPGTIYLEARRR